jgi:hypothetical protein
VISRRVSIRMVRDILRRQFDLHLSFRQIGESLGLHHTTVAQIVRRLLASGQPWSLPETVRDSEIERWVYPPRRGRPRRAVEPDWAAIPRELQQPGVPFNCCGSNIGRPIRMGLDIRNSVRMIGSTSNISRCPYAQPTPGGAVFCRRRRGDPDHLRERPARARISVCGHVGVQPLHVHRGASGFAHPVVDSRPWACPGIRRRRAPAHRTGYPASGRIAAASV